ncbi:fimbrial protein [Cronobacter dublinensis]|nr:fimbrial protein [Cronobacter dublinensis]EKF2292757.1 fimbrial protein [Cronobacter dublinensis]EKF2297878.1 fimbrial protein [Cronobacter dublinensis]EKK5267355.1 fimbrial protein [Cronobacter dublinensis]EKM0137433.1 fimbrial protein [Cronobacter dublinensis]
MKRIKPVLLLATLLASSLGYAQTEQSFAPDYLFISGSLKYGKECTVTLVHENVAINNDLGHMFLQSAAKVMPDAMTAINIAPNDSCMQLLLKNKLAYRLIGTPDNAEGTVLANSDTADSAAKGVGIRLSDRTGALIPVGGTLAAGIGNTPLLITLVKLKGQNQEPGTVKGTLTVEIERL